MMMFYKISFKTNFKGQIKYGHGYYDFEEGGLAFLKPNQIVVSSENLESYEGYSLYFHPDFIRSYPLGAAINQYGFFSYAVSEGLFLSAKEKKIIRNLFNTIADELENSIDHFSQDVLVSQENSLEKGLPSVQFVTAHLNLSPRYLSDMLRSLTGQNTQQYIQNKLIEQSKDLLSSTSLSVAEIAYKLGFEHPQSFSKLFKIKTNQSPLQFRQSFN
jgi:AraC-like DNA-binding protein